MKLLLMSDLHLDSQFSWLGVAGAAAHKRRQNLRDTLLRIMDLAQEEQVDAVLCGGDLYEHDRVTPDTAEFLRSAFARIEPIRVFIAPGNHDWFGPRSVYHRVAWSPNVHIFQTTRLEPVELADGLRLWGAAHCAPTGTRGFLDEFHVEGTAVHIALFHGSESAWLTQQGTGKFPHAPFSEGDIAAAGLTHAFLGHYHTPKDSPWLTYPGNPDPLGFGEDGDRGAVLVRINGRGEIERERRCVAVTELDDRTLDVSGCTHQQQIREMVMAELDGRRGFVRLTLHGEVGPDVDLRWPDLETSFAHLDGVQVRLGALRPRYDIDRLAKEPTVRGQFVRDVLAADDLSEEERDRILSMGLRALDSRSDLEV